MEGLALRLSSEEMTQLQREIRNGQTSAFERLIRRV
jgi:hypothetical protein